MKGHNEQIMPLWMPITLPGHSLWKLSGIWGVLIAVILHAAGLVAIWCHLTPLSVSTSGQPTAMHVAIATISYPKPPEPVPTRQVQPDPVQPVIAPRPEKVQNKPVLTAAQSHREEHLQTEHKPRKIIQRHKTVKTVSHPVNPVEQPQTQTIQAPTVGPDTPTTTGTHPSANLMQTPVTVDASVIHCAVPQPAYPPKARWLHQEGLVRIQIDINQQGQLTGSRIIQHSGSDLLDTAALSAIHNTRCQPYLQQGQPVRVTTVQPFLFRLNH